MNPRYPQHYKISFSWKKPCIFRFRVRLQAYKRQVRVLYYYEKKPLFKHFYTKPHLKLVKATIPSEKQSWTQILEKTAYTSCRWKRL